MLELKTQSFVLEKNPGYHDEGYLLLLTRDNGLIWVLGNGIWKSGAKLSAWSDPPALVEANLILHEKQNFSSKLLNFTPISYFSHIRTSYENFCQFYFYVFVVKHFLPLAVPNIRLFLTLQEVLSCKDWDNETQKNINFAYFLTNALDSEGLCPDWKRCIECQKEFQEECYFIASGEQGFLCKDCLSRKIKQHPFLKQRISLEFLKILPEKYHLQFPEGVIRIKPQEREALQTIREKGDLKTIFAKLNSSSKINDQTIKKVLNFLLLFLGTTL